MVLTDKERLRAAKKNWYEKRAELDDQIKADVEHFATEFKKHDVVPDRKMARQKFRMVCFYERLVWEGRFEAYWLARRMAIVEALNGDKPGRAGSAAERVRKEFGYDRDREIVWWRERQLFRRSKSFEMFMEVAKERLDRLESQWYVRFGGMWMDRPEDEASDTGEGDTPKKRIRRERLNPHEVVKRIWENLGRLIKEDPATGKRQINERALKKVFRHCELEQPRLILEMVLIDKERFFYSVVWKSYGQPAAHLEHMKKAGDEALRWQRERLKTRVPKITGASVSSGEPKPTAVEPDPEDEDPGIAEIADAIRMHGGGKIAE